MAEQTFQQAYQTATSTNILYTQNRDRWQYLLDSYTGGEQYRRGAYLQRYALETDKEYATRLANTPLDNQCRSLISLYTSFLFRTEPQRDLDQLIDNIVIEDLLEDADMDGRSLNAFMKDVATYSSIFGHCWISVVQPTTPAITQADQMAMGVRPYLSVYTPLNVLDWTWQQQANGSYQLAYIKYLEEVNDTHSVIKEWTELEITTYKINAKKKTVEDITIEINQLGRLPFVCAYAERSPVRGLGNSLIEDIADMQRMIYNELSEVYDSIRLDTHPSLVATAETDVKGAAAGQVITIPEAMDPALKPYVLNFQGGQISAIYDSINNRRKMIDGMGNVGAVRATETTAMSGIAIQTEFQLLNARLSSIAANLELAEEQVWQLIAVYMGQPWQGTIDYPSNFALHNTDNEIDQLAKIKTLSQQPEITQAIDQRVAEILQIDLVVQNNAEGEHPSLATSTTAERLQHIQTMLMEGYSNDEIIALHPEVTPQDIIQAGALAAANN
jgi:hypothetical protein